MENINERVREIVKEETDELKSVLDAYFEPHPKETALKIPHGKSTDINLKCTDGDCVYYVDYNVSEIRRTPDGYIIVVYQYENGCGDFENVHEAGLDDEDFIPGEISKLAVAVRKLVYSVDSVYNFSMEQKIAISNFNDAMKHLHKTGVALLVDNCDDHFRFGNAKGIGYFCEPGNGDNTIPVDYGRLPRSEFARDCAFFGDDGLGVEPECDD